MAVRARITQRPAEVIAQAPRTTPRNIRLYAQHIGDDSWTLPDGTTTTDMVLLRAPIPTALLNANDYTEQAVTQTSSTLQIDQRFVLAENFMQELTIDGLARVICRVGAKGDGTYATTLDRIILDIEKVDSAGTYTSLASKDITLSTALSTTGTAWVTGDWQVLLSISRQVIETTENLVLRARIYAYMATGGTAQAVRLYYTRGSGDTLVDIPVDEL